VHWGSKVGFTIIRIAERSMRYLKAIDRPVRIMALQKQLTQLYASQPYKTLTIDLFSSEIAAVKVSLK
jgi:hypothetical protein